MRDTLDPAPNKLYTLKSQLIKEGQPIQDWVSGNVTEHGIAFPPDILQSAFAQGIQASAIYQPDPLGQRVARESISRFYQQAGLSIPPEQILLTPGTSMGYLYAFKLLGEPGDEFLCPSPNYPLFDMLAKTAGVELTSYPLVEENQWRMDIQALERAITPKTRAIVIVSPHNPTGSVTTVEELRALSLIARENNLAVISDEVFRSFYFGPGTLPHPLSTELPLLLTLNGLSKMLALPGLKIAWMAVSGYPDRVARAMQRLDLMADTFLPVSEPTQQALPTLLDHRAAFQKSYVETIRQRANTIRKALQDIPEVEVLPYEGGFYTVLKLRRGSEEETACRILKQAHVLVHPGYFYDLAGDHLVLSHVSRPEGMLERMPQVAAAITSA